VDESVDPSMIDWAVAAYKRRQDPVIQSYIMNAFMEPDTRVVCLPAAQWQFEMSLANAFPDRRFYFYGVERDDRVREKMRRNANWLNQMVPNASFFPVDEPELTKMLDEALPQVQPHALYLDYMGTWAQEKIRHMRQVARACKPGTVIVLTLSLLRGSRLTNDEIKQAVLEESWDYMSVMSVDDKCRLQDGSITRMKVDGVPTMVSRIFQEEGSELAFLGGSVYGSFSKTGLSRVCPEMTIAFQMV
jgi:hypothetical protein